MKVCPKMTQHIESVLIPSRESKGPPRALAVSRRQFVMREKQRRRRAKKEGVWKGGGGREGGGRERECKCDIVLIPSKGSKGPPRALAVRQRQFVMREKQMRRRAKKEGVWKGERGEG